MHITLSSKTSQASWYCFRDPSGDFRTRIFHCLMVESPEGWDNGVAFVNLRTGELRQIWDQHLHIDFLFDPLCPRGFALYASFIRSNRCLKNMDQMETVKGMAPAYKALSKHTRDCPACRAMLEVRYIKPVTGALAFA